MPTFEEIRDDLFVGIMMEFEFSDEINEQTILLLNQLSRDDVLAVHWCAEDLVAGRRFEVEFRDGDMAEVIEKMDVHARGPGAMAQAKRHHLRNQRTVCVMISLWAPLKSASSRVNQILREGRPLAPVETKPAAGCAAPNIAGPVSSQHTP